MPIDVSRAEVQHLLNAGRALVVEVLPAEEYEAEHIAGAVSLPLEHLTRQTAAELLGERAPIVVYCQDPACDLSSRAAWRLEALGYRDVRRYAAGKTEWLACGLPAAGTEQVQRIESLREPVATCGLHDRVGDVRTRLDGADLCVVVNDAGIVLGDLRGEKLRQASATAIVEEVMSPGPSTYRPNVSVVEMAAHLATRPEVQRVLIADADGRLLGLLHRTAVEQAASSAG